MIREVGPGHIPAKGSPERDVSRALLEAADLTDSLMQDVASTALGRTQPTREELRATRGMGSPKTVAKAGKVFGNFAKTPTATLKRFPRGSMVAGKTRVP